MNIAMAEKIAAAVLYEGYMLYPYRPSSVKNRQRWTFGGIYPPEYSAIQGGSDRSAIRTECLLLGGRDTNLEIRVRFLQLQDRTVGALDDSQNFISLDQLQVGNRNYRPWQEAIEREIVVDFSPVARGIPSRRSFSFPAQRERECLYNDDGKMAGIIWREQQALEGAIEFEIEAVSSTIRKVTLRVLNQTPFPDAATGGRDAALLQSFVSAHAVLCLRGGEFLSSLDPPEEFRELATQCHNEGVYPVLVGEEGERDMMLASPIILYDYPQIAPESPGDLFDGTEIDEILTLRILTMTEDEKREARQSDERACALLDRTEALPWEELSKLHGMMRQIRSSATHSGSEPI